MSEHNHIRAVLTHYANGGARKGKVTHVEVQHDNECALFAGGACDCGPTVATGPAVDRKHGRRP
jgi:hypothetical protein